MQNTPHDKHNPQDKHNPAEIGIDFPRPVDTPEAIDSGLGTPDGANPPFTAAKSALPPLPASFAPASPVSSVHTLTYPRVVDEMLRLQNKKTNWLSALTILGVSAMLFLAAGLRPASNPSAASNRSWELLALLVPVLLFHELGHYLSMRVFGYRNLRMFFIPFFGAAVSGKNYTAPGWKKVIVSLMGPLPGIVVGAIVGVLGIVLHQDVLLKIALLLLTLNGFNLLPILPFDGGRVMQALLFSRHYLLDIAFRVIAAVALFGLGLRGMKICNYLGIITLLGIPLAYRMGRIAHSLRKEGIIPPASSDATIQPDVADQIVVRLRQRAFSARQNSNKITAQNALTVYETLATRPPGILATIGFLVMHIGAIGVALLFTIVVVIAQHGGLTDFARAAAAAPRTPVSTQEIEFIPATLEPAVPPPSTAATIVDPDLNPDPDADEDGPAPVVPRWTTILADFATLADAKNAYSGLTARVHPDQSFERFGQTLLVSIPGNDIKEKRQWVDTLTARTKNVVISNGAFSGAAFTLVFIAHDEASAADLQTELDSYLKLPRQFNLIPPWSPDDKRTPAEKAKHKLARQTYLRLQSAGSGSFNDPRSIAMRKAMADAVRYSDQAEIRQISEAQTKLHKQIRNEELAAVQSDASADREIVDLFLALQAPAARSTTVPTSQSARPPFNSPRFDSTEYQAIAKRMGRLPDYASISPLRYSAAYGRVTRVGMLETLHVPDFDEAVYGAPALLRWLEANRCIGFKYRFATDLSRSAGLSSD